MGVKKFLGIKGFIWGVVLIAASAHIANRVAAGREEIAGAQDQVNQAEGIFGITPVTAEVGEDLAEPNQEQIDFESQRADKYAVISRQIQVGGAILLAIAIALLVMPRKKRHHK